MTEHEHDTHSAFSRSGNAGPGGRIIWLAGPDSENRDALAEALAELLAEQGAMIMLLPDRDEDGVPETADPAKLARSAPKAAADGLTVMVASEADQATLTQAREGAKKFALFHVYDSSAGQDAAEQSFADVRLDTSVLDGAAACELCLAFLDNWQ